jgi:vitamin K-dependent gamma-carboxylase
MLTRSLERLNRPCDAAGFLAFRSLFGLVMLFGVLRFAARGWISEMYVAPHFHFSYLGFGFLHPLPAAGMYACFALMGAAALALSCGFRPRISALVFLLTFSYVELLDKTNYLNHYYFVSCVALLLTFIGARSGSVPAYVYVLLRAQLVLVYFFAGFAKLNADWLLHGEPLTLWLRAYEGLPVVGALLGSSTFALLVSWAGALYDLSIGFLLLSRRARPFAYVAVVLFHVTVWLLFPIGIFSWVMIACTTIFFDPSWPRRLYSRWFSGGTRGLTRTERNPLGAAHAGALGLAASTHGTARPLGALGAALFAGYLLVQLLVPLRYLAYPGDVLWTQQGFRFAWRVMLIEKTGSVEYRVAATPPRGPAVAPRCAFVVRPASELTPLQYRMMSTEPDMIHEYALELAARYRGRGYTDVRVYADAWAALNGRPSQRLVEPDVDLAAERLSIWPKLWIVPLESRTTRDERVARGK